MDHFKELRLKKNYHQFLLFILFLIYLVFNIKTPETVAKAIDNAFGMTIVIVVAIALFCFSNPILGFTGFIVAYELIRRSRVATGSQAIQQYITTENEKYRQMESFNNDTNNNKFYSSLEEEVVTNMVPYINQSGFETSNVKPVLETQHDAASIHYNGVV